MCATKSQQCKPYRENINFDKKMRKIHIIGACGSGKTYIAQKLSNILNISHYDLDDAYWSPINNDYSTPFSDKEMAANLNKILRHESWIVEGAYCDWVDDVFKSADIIIILNVNMFVRDCRIIKRFICGKFKKSSRKEGFGNLIHMLKWNHKCEDKFMRDALVCTQPFASKRHVIKSVHDAIGLLER